MQLKRRIEDIVISTLKDDSSGNLGSWNLNFSDPSPNAMPFSLIQTDNIATQYCINTCNNDSCLSTLVNSHISTNIVPQCINNSLSLSENKVCTVELHEIKESIECKSGTDRLFDRYGDDDAEMLTASDSGSNLDLSFIGLPVEDSVWKSSVHGWSAFFVIISDEFRKKNKKCSLKDFV